MKIKSFETLDAVFVTMDHEMAYLRIIAPDSSEERGTPDWYCMTPESWEVMGRDGAAQELEAAFQASLNLHGGYINEPLPRLPIR